MSDKRYETPTCPYCDSEHVEYVGMDDGMGDYGDCVGELWACLDCGERFEGDLMRAYAAVRNQFAELQATSAELWEVSWRGLLLFVLGMAAIEVAFDLMELFA